MWEYVKDVLGSIGSFNVPPGFTGISATLGTTEGRADSGNLDIDLEELVEDLATAMARSNAGFGIFIDERSRQILNVASMPLLGRRRRTPFGRSGCVRAPSELAGTGPA